MPRSEVAARRELSASHRMMQVTERELQNVYLELGVRNRTEAAACYLRTRGGAARPRGGTG